LNGPSPFLRGSPEESVLALQLYLTAIAVPVLLLSAALDQLRNAEQTTRALASSLLKAQDEERRRIARELHDSTGQNLVAASLLVTGFRDSLPQAALTHLKNWEDVLQQAVHEVRTLSYVLHPPALDESGLRSALPTYIQGFCERTGIKVDLEMSPDIERLSPDAELVVYRIVQEALGNVHRHSGSATALIGLHRRRAKGRDFAVLTIEDSGRGFKAAGSSRRSDQGLKAGLGLESMRERIHQIGGRLTIESAPGKTVVTGIFPIEDAI
jgi:signal transduction histidine kinase